MLIQASVFRLLDGVPLSASTENDQRFEVRECQRYVKLLVRRSRTLPDRCTLHLEGFHIHFVSALELVFLVVCGDTYPPVLAFSFLDEIQKEFISTYDRAQVQTTQRPYKFIEFGSYLQKTKQKYNSTQSLITKINVADMSTEIKLRPPHEVTSHELGLVDNCIIQSRTDSFRPTVSPERRLIPVDWIDMLSVLMNMFCAALNLTRGMTIVSHGHFDEDDDGVYEHGTAFLIASLASIYQVFLTFYYGRLRHVQAVLLLGILTMCLLYLQQFRNIFQISFHLFTALFSTFIIINRTLTEKLPAYAV